MKKNPPGKTGDKVNDSWVFSNTKIIQGDGKMIVMAVGKNTCVGTIGENVAGDADESSELTKKLDQMVHDISLLGIIISVVTGIIMLIIWSILHFGYGMVADEATNTPAFWADKSGEKSSWDSDTDPDFLVDVFITVVTILVVAIPEGLPLAVTLSLAYSVSKMDDKEAGQFNQVKKIDCAETMGSATTICTDKTGTLTENKMVVTSFVAAGHAPFTKEDGGAEINGLLEQAGFSKEFVSLVDDSCAINTGNKSQLQYRVEAAEIGVEAKKGSSAGWWIKQCIQDGEDEGKWQYYSTDMDLEEGATSIKWTNVDKDKQTKIDDDFLQKNGDKRDWKVSDGGNPTEGALLGMIYASGGSYPSLREQENYKGTDDKLKIGRNKKEVLKFTSNIKMMAWAVPHEGKTRLFVKGAGEVVLARSIKVLKQDGKTEEVMSEDGRKALTANLGSFADAALRTISLAYRDFSAEESQDIFNVDNEMTSDEWAAAYLQEMTLVGITGIKDPLKKGVRKAIAACFNAGIDVRMITGDNLQTAVAIALDAGILREEHFEHIDAQHPMNDKRDNDKYFTMLQNHKTIKAMTDRMRKDGKSEEFIQDFEKGCEKCRGTMELHYDGYDATTYKAEDYDPNNYKPDRVKALREHVAMEGSVFALQVHSKEFSVGHVKDKEGVAKVGEANATAYGIDVAQWKETQEAKKISCSLPEGVNQEALDDIWPRLRVMARCHPDDKLTLVAGLMESQVHENRAMMSKLEGEGYEVFTDNQVVAVTGDGTNDAQALSRANVGFAMGIAGTDVAIDACDIIIKDDNFTSVVESVKWGRNVYDSVAKFLQFQLTVNVVAVICASLGAVIYQASPLGAVQMLWVNLVMDSLGSLALATEAPTDALLNRKPYGRNMTMIQRPMKCNIIGQSIYQLAVVLFIMFYGEKFFYYSDDRGEQDNAKDGSSELISGRAAGCDATQHYTILFNTFVMMTLFNQIAARKLNNEYNLFAGITENKIFLSIMFVEFIAQIIFVQFAGNFAECYSDGLTWRQWLWCLGLGMSVWPVQCLVSFVANNTKGDPEIEAAQERAKQQVLSQRDPEPEKEKDLIDKMNASRNKSHSRYVVCTPFPT